MPAQNDLDTGPFLVAIDAAPAQVKAALIAALSWKGNGDLLKGLTAHLGGREGSYGVGYRRKALGMSEKLKEFLERLLQSLINDMRKVFWETTSLLRQAIAIRKIEIEEELATLFLPEESGKWIGAPPAEILLKKQALEQEKRQIKRFENTLDVKEAEAKTAPVSGVSGAQTWRKLGAFALDALRQAPAKIQSLYHGLKSGMQAIGTSVKNRWAQYNGQFPPPGGP